MRLVTKINRTFAMELGLDTLISSPTIEALADLIRKQHECPA